MKVFCTKLVCSSQADLLSSLTFLHLGPILKNFLHFKITSIPNKVECFVPDRSFQPSLMFVSKAEPTQEEGLLGAPHLGRLIASPTSIRLGWKDLSWRNTLAY